MYNVVILIKSVFNKNQNHYYKIFLEKCSDELAKNNEQFFVMLMLMM